MPELSFCKIKTSGSRHDVMRTKQYWTNFHKKNATNDLERTKHIHIITNRDDPETEGRQLILKFMNLVRCIIARLLSFLLLVESLLGLTKGYPVDNIK